MGIFDYFWTTDQRIGKNKSLHTVYISDYIPHDILKVSKSKYLRVIIKLLID